MIILKRKHIDIEMDMPKTAVEGRFSFKKYKNNGQLVQEVAAVQNLITDAGLVMIGTGFSANIFVGTGTSTPSFTDTVLNAYRNHTNTIQIGWNGKSALSPVAGEWVEGSGTWRFAAGAASGNLTEVGIGRVISASPLQYELFSRALIVDAAGNPVTITVLSDEYLDVTYTIRSHCPVADYDTSLVISGVTYDMRIGRYYVGNNDFTGTSPMSACAIYDPNGNFDIFGHSGTIAFSGGINSTSPFNAGSVQTQSGRVNTVAEPSNNGALATISVAIDKGNAAGGIKGFAWSRASRTTANAGVHASRYRATVTPAIPKNNTNILSFGMRWTWGRKT